MLVQLLNYKDHPEDTKYLVFQFYTIEMAIAFEQYLTLANIPFEKDEDIDDRNYPRYLFGVRKVHQKEAIRCNNKVMAAHKQKFIPQKGMRLGLLIFTFLMILFALSGYLISK